MAVKLGGFAGCIGMELCPDRRLGTEMADHAKFAGGVRGIFHTDELPAYDITVEELEALRNRADVSDADAMVIVADDEESCRKALSAVVKRAREALEGVPSETRAANPDGTTHFTRPRPGAARMYPETDVPPIVVSSERIARLKANLPEMPEAKLERFTADYGINAKLAKQVINSDYTQLYEEMMGESLADPVQLAVTLTEDFRGLQRDGVEIGNISDTLIRETFGLLKDGKTAKEALPQIFTWLSENSSGSPADALDTLGLGMIGGDELRRMVETKVSENQEMVERLGDRAMGPLMGMMMGEVRGRAEAKDVQALLREALGSSYNLPAVKVLDAIGLEHLATQAREMGITTFDRATERFGRALTLGGGEVTMVELASAYGVFATGGNLVTPIAIQAINNAIAVLKSG